MNAITKAYWILRYLGFEFAWIRARLLLSQRLGLKRRKYPITAWDRIELARIAVAGTPTSDEDYAEFKRRQSPPFFFPLGQPPAIPDSIRLHPASRQPALAERVRLLSEDRCVYFLNAPAAEPIDWYANTLTGGRGVADRLWCDVPHFAPEQGDARTMWEPSRAAWAIDAARAHAYGLDVNAGALFWRWVDSWMNACPPFTGVQWTCGQEATVRMIAVALGFWAVADHEATTPGRWARFARLAWATGYRIFDHIDYAVSQKNNHAISEACGLLLVSHLFPEFREAGKWWARGRRVLRRELRRQVYDDGSYVQESMNYERVMLHGAILALRLAELAGDPFEREFYDRLERCGEFLFQMMDDETGRLPNYGANDGSLVLPLNECDFTDYRPVIQTVHYLSQRRRRLPPGPWAEELLWIFGREALDTDQTPERRPASTAFATGGYYTLRRSDSWALIRCRTCRDRPGQEDNLHVDLWWRGQNVLQDCGSYQYFARDREDVVRYFHSLAGHNTIRIDQCEPSEFISRFLRVPWPRARKRQYRASGVDQLWFEGESYAYDRSPWNVLHRRTVLSLPGDLWLVIDDLLGVGRHHAALYWHLLDAPYELEPERRELKLNTPPGDLFITLASCAGVSLNLDVVRGRDEAGKVQGFASTYYGERHPIPVLEATTRAALPVRLMTAVSPNRPTRIRPAGQAAGGETWELECHERHFALELARPLRESQETLLSCRAVRTERPA